jgi:mitochondrial fission protein ELM1
VQSLGCEIAATRQPLYITRKAHDYVENILLQHLDSHREETGRLFDEHYISPVTPAPER